MAPIVNYFEEYLLTTKVYSKMELLDIAELFSFKQLKVDDDVVFIFYLFYFI